MILHQYTTKILKSKPNFCVPPLGMKHSITKKCQIIVHLVQQLNAYTLHNEVRVLSRINNHNILRFDKT